MKSFAVGIVLMMLSFLFVATSYAKDPDIKDFYAHEGGDDRPAPKGAKPLTATAAPAPAAAAPGGPGAKATPVDSYNSDGSMGF